MVHPREHAGDRELLLGQERRHEVVLVVAGGRHDDLGLGQLGLLEHPRLAGVAEHDADVGHDRPNLVDDVGFLLDQGDLVPARGEVCRQVPPDRAAARHHDAHQWCSPGAASCWSSSSMPSLAIITTR